MSENNNILKLPVLMLRTKTVFPYMLISFEITNKRMINAVKETMLDERGLPFCAQKNTTHMPTMEDVYDYGVIGKIKRVLRTITKTA